jgi:hypothetical protein
VRSPPACLILTAAYHSFEAACARQLWLQHGHDGTHSAQWLTHTPRACRPSADPGPLSRAQHLVYMAAFFNLERAAAQNVSDIQTAYDDLVAAPAAKAPTVLWLSYLSDISFSQLSGPNGKALTGAPLRRLRRASVSPWRHNSSRDRIGSSQ